MGYGSPGWNDLAGSPVGELAASFVVAFVAERIALFGEFKQNRIPFKCFDTNVIPSMKNVYL